MKNILRERRVILGLTQQQVADKAGIKIQHYQGFEGGQRNLITASFKVACSVLEALDLDIARYYHGGYDLQKTLEVHEEMNLPYPEITQQEFCDHIEDDDFFLVYGNPVIIRADSGAKLLAVAFPMYERIMRSVGRGGEIDQIIKECAVLGDETSA